MRLLLHKMQTICAYPSCSVCVRNDPLALQCAGFQGSWQSQLGENNRTPPTHLQVLNPSKMNHWVLLIWVTCYVGLRTHH